MGGGGHTTELIYIDCICCPRQETQFCSSTTFLASLPISGIQIFSTYFIVNKNSTYVKAAGSCRGTGRATG